MSQSLGRRGEGRQGWKSTQRNYGWKLYSFGKRYKDSKCWTNSKQDEPKISMTRHIITKLVKTKDEKKKRKSSVRESEVLIYKRKLK